LIERVVAAEARGETYIGQAAVAEVIFNRAYFWDMTVSEVATAKGQFAKPYQGEITESVKEAVSEIFDKQELSLDGATHFHADYVNPYWSKDKEFVTQIGVHRFYK
jgi:N-acetylmuramoyl-L-alanine amidase